MALAQAQHIDLPRSERATGTPERNVGFQIEPVDRERFSTHRLSRLTHNYQDHPLLQLPALARLAKELNVTKQCRFLMPGTTQSSAFNHKPVDPSGRDIDEVFARIEEPGVWMALYNVESHPQYKAFVEQIADGVRDLVEREQPGMFSVRGYIFISSPPSATPFHIDRENNFWLQLKGRKTMNIWPHTDRTVVAATDVEQFITYGSFANVTLKDGLIQRSQEFNVGPGDGLYFPPTTPHATRCDTSWVKPGDGVSISMGVVFNTRHTRFVANVLVWNAFLRQRGLAPREPGESVWRDRLKYVCGRALVLAKKTVRGYRPPVGV